MSLSPSLSLQPRKFVAKSLFSSSLNHHGCNQQPPSPVHHHLWCYLVWHSPFLRPLSLSRQVKLLLAPTPPWLAALLTGITTTRGCQVPFHFPSNVFSILFFFLFAFLNMAKILIWLGFEKWIWKNVL